MQLLVLVLIFGLLAAVAGQSERLGVNGEWKGRSLIPLCVNTCKNTVLVHVREVRVILNTG